MQTHLTPIIAIVGNSNSGKTTLAKALEALPGVKHIRFSYPMKRFLADRYGVTVEFLDSQEGKQARIYPYDSLTYGEQMIRMWEASSGDRPLIDPRIWMAESEAEIDEAVSNNGAAVVFSDIRNQREVDVIRRLVKDGHKLHLIHLSREDETPKPSDADLDDYIDQLKEAAMFKLYPGDYMRCHERPLKELVKAAMHSTKYVNWYLGYLTDMTALNDLLAPWGGEHITYTVA